MGNKKQTMRLPVDGHEFTFEGASTYGWQMVAADGKPVSVWHFPFFVIRSMPARKWKVVGKPGECESLEEALTRLARVALDADGMRRLLAKMHADARTWALADAVTGK